MVTWNRRELTLKNTSKNGDKQNQTLKDSLETLISQRAYGLSSIMKSSVLTAVLLRDGTAQSKAFELRKVALVLCFSPGTQTPFMNCGGRSTQLRDKEQREREKKNSCTFDFPHLESGGVAAEVGRVDEAEAEDSNVATIEGSNVAQSTVLQVCYLYWLAYWMTDGCLFMSTLQADQKNAPHSRMMDEFMDQDRR